MHTLKFLSDPRQINEQKANEPYIPKNIQVKIKNKKENNKSVKVPYEYPMK